MGLKATRARLERLVEERQRTQEKIEDMNSLAEEDERDFGDSEIQMLEKHRGRVLDLDAEIILLAGDLEREQNTQDASALVRGPQTVELGPGGGEGAIVYRTFAAYARDEMIRRYPQIANLAANGDPVRARAMQEEAGARLERVVNTTTTDIAGLLPPQYLAQIQDIINGTRPVVQSGRFVPLTTGKLTYPRITSRPSVIKQTAEKTEAGAGTMSVVLDTVNAETYLGGGDLSWQTINWSTPDALQLWFDLAAEAYARQTETAACSELGTAGGGTITTPLGTAGTESFAQWRTAVLSALNTIYNNTGGRAMSDTLWVSANRFFQLAGLGTDQVLQVSAVGNMDIGSMTGTWSGLRVIGSYGFTAVNSAIVGDASAFLVSESPNAPVEMRVVEPTIAGMQVGVIGGFKAKVFDPNRFIHLN